MRFNQEAMKHYATQNSDKEGRLFHKAPAEGVSLFHPVSLFCKEVSI